MVLRFVPLLFFSTNLRVLALARGRSQPYLALPPPTPHTRREDGSRKGRPPSPSSVTPAAFTRTRLSVSRHRRWLDSCTPGGQGSLTVVRGLASKSRRFTPTPAVVRLVHAGGQGSLTVVRGLESKSPRFILPALTRLAKGSKQVISKVGT